MLIGDQKPVVATGLNLKLKGPSPKADRDSHLTKLPPPARSTNRGSSTLVDWKTQNITTICDHACVLIGDRVPSTTFSRPTPGFCRYIFLGLLPQQALVCEALPALPAERLYVVTEEGPRSYVNPVLARSSKKPQCSSRRISLIQLLFLSTGKLRPDLRQLTLRCPAASSTPCYWSSSFFPLPWPSLFPSRPFPEALRQPLECAGMDLLLIPPMMTICIHYLFA